MAVDLSFMINGEAGQGIRYISFVLGKVLMHGRYGVVMSQTFDRQSQDLLVCHDILH